MADQANIVLPKELRLAVPATMPQSRSYMFKQQAALSNYKPRDTIQINIPRLQRSYLTKDSYLEFDVSFQYKPTNDAATLCLDTVGAFGLIDRIEVYDYLGSTQLESTAGFGQLVSLLQDTCVNLDEFNNHWESTVGGQTAPIVEDWERGHSLANSFKMYRPMAAPSGEIIDTGAWLQPSETSKKAVTELRTIRRRYHLPLFSFLGLLSPKYAPLHNGYTIMITLQSAENALGSAGITYSNNAYSAVFGTDVNYTIDQCRFACQILELGPIAESMLLSTTGQQPLIVTTKAYRNYQTTVPAKSSSFRLDLNLNVSSLTNVLWFMRPTRYLNSTRFPSLSARQRNFLESWYFQYGSSILPQTQGIIAYKPASNVAGDIDNGSEALIETLKARHLYNQKDHPHAFNKWNWGYDNYYRYLLNLEDRQTAATKHHGAQAGFQLLSPSCSVEKGKFACGLDLELVSGRTNEIICGMNTNGMNTSIFGTFNATAAATDVVAPNTDTLQISSGTGIWVEEVRVDAYCEYDAFINISPGIATTVSF